MKLFLKFLLLTGIALIFSLPSESQSSPGMATADTANYPYWIRMMQDPDARFSATQRAFDQYWAGRPAHKGNGWKVFKRWEYINEPRVQPDGKLRSPDYVTNVYRKYLETHDQRSANGNWTQLGPVDYPANATDQPNGMGRVNAMAFHPSNPNIFYAGSPSGGLWRTTDGGSTWTVLFSDLPTLGVSAILLHPTNENLIYIGTGDRDAGDAPGMGVYKSTDGGTSWIVSNTGMGNKTVGMLLMHPSNPSIILATTSGGIYKSTDGGASWSKKSSNSSHYKDIRFKPGDPATVYATENGKFYRSTDTGDTWSQVTSGVINGSRLVIGVSPAQPGYVYLLQTSGPFAGLLKSTNSGQSFTTQSTSPNIMDYSCNGSGGSSQAWYDLCIAVDPNNANIIYTGGVNIWKSTNGGVNWTINSHWVGADWGESCAPSVHADIHSLDWSPVNGKLYNGGDGGVYWTSNGGTTWNQISSGLAIAQVYKIGQSATVGSLTINGYQDNGTSSNLGSSFTTVIGGDGMEGIIDYSDTNYRYGEIYYGEIFRTNGGEYIPIAGSGINGINESGTWVTPYILHETNSSVMFAGYTNVWRSTNVKTSNPSSVTWSKISSGATGSCSVLEQSPANTDILYVVRSGSIKRSDNVNASSPSWVSCTLPGGTTPADLEAHPTDANTVYAVAGTGVYKSTDKGTSWTNITGTLPGIYLNTIVYDKTSNEGLYVGNETGIFYKEAAMSDWIAYNTGLPVVDVRELEIYYDLNIASSSRIKAATYGRGLWESDLYNTFSVYPPNQGVTYEAGTTAFSVTAAPTTTWSAVSNASWCTVTPSGTGNGTITTDYLENTTIDARVATITVTPSGMSPKTVTVTQAGTPLILTVIPDNQNVTPPAGSTEFTVTSNTDWTAVSDAPWCSVTPSGSGDGMITATYWENTSVENRIAGITVSVSGLSPVEVTVTQTGAPATLTVMPDNQNVTPPAGSTDFTVTSNTDWTAASDAAWCTVTPSGTGNGIITANYGENTSVDTRIAQITVTVAGLSPAMVTVTQAGSAPTLNVAPLNQDVGEDAGTTSFSVTSNTSWNAVSDASWCLITGSGSGNGTIVADYSENFAYEERIASLSVTVIGLPVQMVTVSQAASTVSTGGLTEEGLRIYPNPTKGIFRVVAGINNGKITEVTVLDITGNVVQAKHVNGEKECLFDLSASPQGCYFVRISAGQDLVIRKLVIL